MVERVYGVWHDLIDRGVYNFAMGTNVIGELTPNTMSCVIKVLVSFLLCCTL